MVTCISSFLTDVSLRSFETLFDKVIIVTGQFSPTQTLVNKTPDDAINIIPAREQREPRSRTQTVKIYYAFLSVKLLPPCPRLMKTCHDCYACSSLEPPIPFSRLLKPNRMRNGYRSSRYCLPPQFRHSFPWQVNLIAASSPAAASQPQALGPTAS